MNQLFDKKICRVFEGIYDETVDLIVQLEKTSDPIDPKAWVHYCSFVKKGSRCMHRRIAAKFDEALDEIDTCDPLILREKQCEFLEAISLYLFDEIREIIYG